MSIYNITHSADLDGMASAALMVHYYKIPIENVIFTSYSGKLYDDAIKFIKGIKGSDHTLVISDVGMVEERLEIIAGALSAFRERGNRIVWLDHHLWSERAIKRIADLCYFMIVGENKDFCATELVYRMLCKRDKYGDEIARLTHLSDFALTSKSKTDNVLVEKIGLGINQLGDDNIRNPRLREFVSCLAKNDIDCRVIKDAYKRYVKETAPYLKKMLGSAKVVKVGKMSIAVGFGQKVSHQEGCMELLGKFKTSVSIYISTDSGTASIRSVRDSKSWGVDSYKIAVAFSGGGHPLASGFPLKGARGLSKTSTQEKVVQRIEAVAKKLYGKKIDYYQQNTGKHKTVKVR